LAKPPGLKIFGAGGAVSSEFVIRKKSYVVQMPGQRMRVAYEKA
jgi:hypothetical protein